jgi:aryl-alcohol dehydrogenase-like predicted oxidoreductase
MASSSQVELPPTLKKSVENSKADYLRLGKSGLRLSLPILGCMSFGHRDWLPWVIEEEAGLDLLYAAYDRGLNTWDTANVYSSGVSEEIIGKAFASGKIERKKVVLLTKCFAVVGEEPAVKAHLYKDKVDASKDYVNQYGLSRAAIFNAVDGCLKRLQTDYIDLFQIHRFDKDVPIEETMEALHDLVRSGKVRYIGASSMFAYQFAMMQQCAERHGWTKFVSMQNHYSLLYREEEREMNRYCDETGVGLIPWGPLNAGNLARPVAATEKADTERSEANKANLSEADKAIINRVEEIAKKKGDGWTMSHVALAWAVQKGTIPIVGLSSVARLDETLLIRGKRLSEDEMKYLEEPYVPKNIWGHS